MLPLNRSTLASLGQLPAGLSCGPLATYPERIVQFGEGNFLRAFADWMIDEVNDRGLLGSNVLVVQPIRQGLAGMLNAQDGLYTVLARGVQNGKVVESRRIVTAVRRALDPYTQWETLVAAFRGADLRFVLSNTTEAGIAYVPEALVPGQCPESFPAKIAALLYERYQAVAGDLQRGLIFLPCELIENNGGALRAAVRQQAEAWGLPAGFRAWLDAGNYFCSTLVDRIVPGYPRNEAAQLAQELGYEDKLIAATEAFHLWVIEGPAKLADELPFARAGLNVVWTDDMKPYRNRKVRVLNGAHTASVLAAYAAGIDTVRDMMDDPVFGAFVRQAVFGEILPQIALPEAERAAYATAVLERFSNPFIRHELLSISLNSVSKWKVRVLPSLLDSQRSSGRLPPLLTFSLAALLWFYRGVKLADGSVQGRRDGKPYPIRDDAPIVAFFTQAWSGFTPDQADKLVAATLARQDFWGQDLNTVPGLAAVVTAAIKDIATSGMKATAARLVTAATEVRA